MNLMSRGMRIVLVATALAVPLEAASCGRSACISVTPAQLLNGACPARQSALARFSSPSCPGDVTSVDSDGTLDGTLCCYAVTTNDSNDETACGEGGSFADGSFDGEESSGFTGTTGGFGGGTSPCTTCQETLNGSPGTLCTESLAALQALQTCACNGECMTTCDPNLCIGNAPDVGCLSCLQTSCTTQLSTCHSE